MSKTKNFCLLATVCFISFFATSSSAGLFGSENPFAQFYFNHIGKLNILKSKTIEISSGDPQLVHGTNSNDDGPKLIEDGYGQIGYSYFNAGSINESDAIAFGRQIHAAIVLLYAPYTPDMPGDDPVAFADFQQKARVWRALSQKPPLPEEVHRFLVLKDDAVQNNDFDKAVGFYEKGLAIDPMWPAGQYNAALIYEELKNYHMAAMHMKLFLALEPDTKDARADQDKIYLWEEKANEAEIAASAASHRYNYLAIYWVKLKPSLLGIYVSALDPEERRAINSNKGVKVVVVIKNSPAFMADLFKDDIIKTINGTEIVDPKSFVELLKENAGKMVTLSII